jgi:Lrp/AsnC family leucine-responsive transcriptional regulator
MDDIDRKIVAALVGNGRLTHEQIAKTVHLSRPAVFERIRRLEARRVIRGYGARVDWEAMGLPLTALVWIRTNSVVCSNTGQQIADAKVEGAMLEDLYLVTGEWCMFAKYRLTSPSVLQQVVHSIRQVPGVVNTMTNIALSSILELQGTASPASPIPGIAI